MNIEPILPKKHFVLGKDNLMRMIMMKKYNR